MLKNKNGWSIVGELVAILIAVLLLVYSIYGLNQLGLVRNMNDALGPGIKPILIMNGTKTNYSNVESELIEVSKNYVLEKYNNQFIDDQIIIRVNSLVKDNYFSTIRDEDNKVCSGYVVAKEIENNVIYNAYLKCSKYTTPGYESEYDW